MRLLSTTTLEFKETYHPEITCYAILSHRWEKDEVGYEECVLSRQPDDLLPPWQVPGVRSTCQKAGYRKIETFCKCAKDLGFGWCWIDTCCIDKRSSAELSEAINSMWKWYQYADLCIVYLSDVSSLNSGGDALAKAFANSQWFRRCWTLQELLAPGILSFHDVDWNMFFELMKALWFSGSETNGMDDAMTAATRISQEDLRTFFSPGAHSIAQRMSWAADRRATRVEDTAYSLLGLFDINMPLLYGEGKKAFVRLQHEIIRSSNDDSIFAWKHEAMTWNKTKIEGTEIFEDNRYHDVLNCPRWCVRSTFLARSPADFRVCERIASNPRGSCIDRRPHSITNYGLELVTDCQVVHGPRSINNREEFPEDREDFPDDREVFLLELNCGYTAPSGFCRCMLVVEGSFFRKQDERESFLLASRRLHCCDVGERTRDSYQRKTPSFLKHVTFYLPISL